MRRACTIVAIYMRGSGIVQCANAHLPSIGQDLVPDKTALILVPRKWDSCIRTFRENSCQIIIFQGYSISQNMSIKSGLFIENYRGQSINYFEPPIGTRVQYQSMYTFARQLNGSTVFHADGHRGKQHAAAWRWHQMFEYDTVFLAKAKSRTLEPSAFDE